MIALKPTLDKVFEGVKFDKEFYKKIVVTNISFITKGENKNLFGGQLIGCYLVKYTFADKDEFFTRLFDVDYSEIDDAIRTVTTIDKDFKIARDSINVTCFYIAHRFLTNKSLSEKERLTYASEILNYFNYRTLVTICSNYFIYPISEEEAISLFEVTSNRYIIKKVKNWNEYCQYRSNEYLKSKFKELLYDFNDDEKIPNAINDLFIRTKDTLKNIYGEFVKLQHSTEIIKQKKAVIQDLEGKEVLADKLNSYEQHYNYILNVLSDRITFIKRVHEEITIDIIKNISYKMFHKSLNIYYDYTHLSSTTFTESTKIINNILVNTITYIQKNNLVISEGQNIIKIINVIVGNLLYARGTDVEINKLKNDLSEFISEAYKNSDEKKLSPKSLSNVRNAIYVYILLRTFIE